MFYERGLSAYSRQRNFASASLGADSFLKFRLTVDTKPPASAYNLKNTLGWSPDSLNRYPGRLYCSLKLQIRFRREDRRVKFRTPQQRNNRIFKRFMAWTGPLLANVEGYFIRFVRSRC